MLLFAWAALGAGMKIVWIVTLIATAIFLVQSIATFIGAGGEELDIDADSDGLGADMNLYTFRNLVNFCLGFGWSFLILRASVSSTALLVILSILIGAALVAAVMYLFKWLSTMQQSGNINVRKSAPGCKGKVYLTVPAERKGSGKVQITINNTVREYAAVTDGEAIQTGELVNVVEAVDDETLLVEPQESIIV